MFYVYVLFRPWNGLPCYVGKGKGKRMQAHFWAGTKHENMRLRRVFAKAARLGLEVPGAIVRENLTEKDAFETESALIGALGRGSKGLLCNLSDGGDGSTGARRTAKEKENVSRCQKERWNKISAKDRVKLCSKSNLKRSEAVKRYWAGKSKKERNAYMRRARADRTSKDCAEWGKKGAAGLSLEQRRQNAINGWAKRAAEVAYLRKIGEIV